jgi:hypothetical protein
MSSNKQLRIADCGLRILAFAMREGWTRKWLGGRT